MEYLLKFSKAVDWFNGKLAILANGAVLMACVISAANAMIRYAFDISSNAWLELQWYLFAVVVMFGASYTLQKNEHVRVDVFYMQLSPKMQAWTDIIGGVLFLLPACAVIGYYSWHFFLDSWVRNEISTNAGGLIRWPVKFIVPLGFFLLFMQGLSEIIKRIAVLEGLKVELAAYERPDQ
jgi:TRAP-type mannitol/chloroaromatic compound transport system permease small subunit